MTTGWGQIARILLAGALLAAAGCGSGRKAYVTEERLDHGLVVSLDGVGGYNWGPRWLRKGLDEAGVEAALVIYDWSKGPGGMFVGDLMDESRNRAVAHDLARTVATYAAAMPERPVTLIGHSGGAAVVVWALEAMPERCRVERVVLLAPALAPDYDLSPALKRVEQRMYVMHSPADVGLMAAGTAVFGTMDGRHSVSAGLAGFHLPAACADRDQYAKVRQVRWTLDLLKAGHLGGHMGWTTTRFARDFLGPILLGRRDPGRPMVVVQPSATASRPGDRHARRAE
ncbi:MAG: alpha/beta hydrolase [Planctomycetota bacterium]|nr:alpha/beta hydrolase [Planctomycetota bacterium]